MGTFITGDDGLVYSNTTYKSYNVFTNYYDESDYQITKWTVSLFGENVSIVYNNGEMDSPEDYFVDMDGIPYIYSYYDDALIEVNGIVDGDYVFNYYKAEQFDIVIGLRVNTKEQAVNGV